MCVCAVRGIQPQINVIYHVGHFCVFQCSADNTPADLQLNATNDWSENTVIA